MPASTYLPTTEAELLSFADNFNSKLSVDPEDYGITVAQAADFTTLYDAFVAAKALLNNPSTATTPNVQTKNAAKEALINGENGIRQLVNIIQAYPKTTNTQRADLQITIRDTDPTPVNPPETAPVLTIESVVGRTVHFRLKDAEDPDSRARPKNAIGATVLSYVGTEAPAAMSDWKNEGMFSRTSDHVDFPATVPAGAQVWLTAYWLNSKGESSPGAVMQTTNVAGAMPAAA